MAHVLITGASGFIASHTLMAWPEDDVVTAVSRVDADLGDEQAFVALLERVRPDVVVHLAWVASGTPDYRGRPENAALAQAAMSAARWCRQADVRFVAAGTVLDDGSSADAYATAKQALRKGIAREIETDVVTWLRPYYVFDPVLGRPGVLRAATHARAEDSAVELARPEARHDFVHVGDVARAVIAAVRHDLRGVVEIGSGRLRRVSDLVEAAGARWVHGPRADDEIHDETAADVTRLLRTGWAPDETERFFHP